MTEEKIYTVGELTREIKKVLEENFGWVIVEGEISNFRVAQSGHCYFVLKDETAQLNCVMWRTEFLLLDFKPEDGKLVQVSGELTVYEQRGQYQLIVETMKESGLGALYKAFLELKDKLQNEGLFDVKHKKPLPMLPQRIGIVTSPTGAAIRDLLNILKRRFANLHIYLIPVRVQGKEAVPEIVKAIKLFNRLQNVDVIIVGRGGGSIEDLWAFNDEQVVRAVAPSRAPVISGVGHETDFTLCDFAADLRAPPPTAAAE
ncbi:MAG: exodeoxyribonuclease VII large subunit, partial [Candidatus Sumerlaeia bacterium]|nr:exodeoxyribonuclease VII large subunit [Candidatus Sumerlaeia bacterium]